MHWFELIINGSSKLMKEGCVHTRQLYLLPSIFMLVRGASPKRTNILLDGVGSSIISRSIKLVMQLGKIKNTHKSNEQRLVAVI